jgi:adenylate cyclase|tara:strand:- start:2490 stop:4271 length:1782 start_codon:yes stop_codon:yes gene_type:complete
LKWTLPALVVVLSLRVLDPWPIETIRLKYFDVLLTSKEPVESQSISLYNIDENELARGGQWPWPRQQLAELSRELRDLGVAAVVYSVLFPEEDRFGGDAEFAESMAEIPTFLSAVATADTDRQDGWQIGVATLGEVHENAINYPGILPNVAVLQDAAVGTGVVNTAPEVDGLVRRVPMVVRVGESLYPALGLDVLRGLAGDPSYQVRGSETGIEAVRVPSFDTINTDAAGRIWTDWSTEFSQEPLAGTIAFVGVTAAGVTPMVPTPQGLMYPHQIQAALLETLLNGTAPLRPDWSLAAEITLIFGLGVLAIVLTRFLGALWVPAGLGSIGILTVGASVWAFLRFGLLVDAALPVLFTAVVGGVGVAQRMIAEYQQKLQIKRQFEHYLDPRQVQRLQKNPELLKLGGETKVCTFLFTDLRGFTSLSERLSPAEVTEIMNATLTVQVEEIQRAGGMVDKFIGDAAMAIFNCPLDLDEHENRAVEVAVRIQQRIKELNKTLSVEVAIGVGVNTGPAVIGNMGSDTRFDFSAIGNAVNEAARYESATKEVGVDILIGQTTAENCKYVLKSLPSIYVKGKEKPLQIYTLDQLVADKRG